MQFAISINIDYLISNWIQIYLMGVLFDTTNMKLWYSFQYTIQREWLKEHISRILVKMSFIIIFSPL